MECCLRQKDWPGLKAFRPGLKSICPGDEILRRQDKMILAQAETIRPSTELNFFDANGIPYKVSWLEPRRCKHPSFSGCSMDDRVLCSFNRWIYFWRWGYRGSDYSLWSIK